VPIGESDVTTIPDVIVMEHDSAHDKRGRFQPLVRCETDGELPIRQVNLSVTSRLGTVRGLHYQSAPHADGKFVSCIVGQVFDVAVDLRKGSPTFLQWQAEELSASNGKTVYIPPGFAHGFQALTDDVHLVYAHTADYRPGFEAGLDAIDPTLGIRWPLPILLRSSRDEQLPTVGLDFDGISE
jgi:dTDP-4-dehydrorhamnose 3,5-epimerase